uniref:C2H2-type domain-containing protein n=1 Tax=Lutzomyia longipalpis TaxID=7200 RepID=A0A1B0F015_LUTLO
MNPYWSNTVPPVRPRAVQEPQPPEPSQIFICGEPYTEPTIKIEISSDSEDVSGFSSNDDLASLEDPGSSELNNDPKGIEMIEMKLKQIEGDKKEENVKEEEKEEEGASKKEKKLTHKCPICEKTFGRSYHVRYHMASHATELDFQCPECPKAFADDIRLGRHVKRVHAKGEPQICQICGKSFKSAEYLRLHSNRHSDVKKYGCELCGMRYTQSQHLKMHIMRVHEGKSVLEVRRKGRK